MDRIIVTQPGHSEIASSTLYFQCTVSTNKQALLIGKKDAQHYLLERLLDIALL